jgi:hypothetical protein
MYLFVHFAASLTSLRASLAISHEASALHSVQADPLEVSHTHH